MEWEDQGFVLGVGEIKRVGRIEGRGLEVLELTAKDKTWILDGDVFD